MGFPTLITSPHPGTWPGNLLSRVFSFLIMVHLLTIHGSVLRRDPFLIYKMNGTEAEGVLAYGMCEGHGWTGLSEREVPL